MKDDRRERDDDREREAPADGEDRKGTDLDTAMVDAAGR